MKGIPIMANATTTTGKEAKEQTTPKPRKDLVTKVGNIGKVEDDGTIALRITPGGKSVCNFDIAVNTGKDEDKRTEWYRITCWDSLADNVVACLTTGNRVIVWGVPDIDEYTDKDGNTRKQKKINAWSVGIDLNFQQGTVQKIDRNSSYDNQDEPF
jgi:single stranded DNA-binding protein